MIPERIRLYDYKTGQFWESESLLRIGRLATLEVCLGDDSVSRRHAEVSQSEDGSWSVRDLGSTNGTFVNGHRNYNGEPQILLPGDLLRFGQVEIVVGDAAVRSATDWDTCDRPLPLLTSFCPSVWRAPEYERKLRLWTVACVRRQAGIALLQSHNGFLNRMLGRIESLIDVEAKKADCESQGLLAEVMEWEGQVTLCQTMTLNLIETVESLLTFGEARGSLFERLIMYGVSWLDPQRFVGSSPHPPWLKGEKISAVNAVLLRCVLGNPWRQPLIDPAWLRWNGAIPALAQGIYADGSFKDLPVLADALEEIGCTDEYLLGHLRTSLHCRGCHVLDAILGRHPVFPVPAECRLVG